MTGKGNARSSGGDKRRNVRVQNLREITMVYEGQNEKILIKPPNISCGGIFISTPRVFPEGAVLDLRFKLLLTNAEICTRGEVRYCMPGVGVGVEFISLAPESAKLIEREIQLSDSKIRPRRTQKRFKQRVVRRARRRRR